MNEATEPRLLVVEDGASSTSLLGPMLLPLGVRLVNASRERALHALCHGRFAAILVDFPATEGELIEMASLYSDCPARSPVPVFFLVVPEHPSFGDLQGYTRQGLEYLHKPVDRRALLAKLGWAIELFRLRELVQQNTLTLGQQQALYEAELVARADAESAMRAREEVLAIVSHDLRNPMSAIVASSSMIARKVGPEVQKQVQMIERSVARMQKLVSDLLEELRIEAGQLALERREQDAVSLLTQAAESMKEVAEQKLLTLSCPFVEEGLRVSCDQERVYQVLSNLLGNAVNFTPPGGRIEMTVARASDEARFSIRDDGPGIPSDQLPHIFNRYWQASYARRKGIGLGLSIAKGIIVAHGGRIWVESEIGVGTTFHFTLPLVGAPDAVTPGPS